MVQAARSRITAMLSGLLLAALTLPASAQPWCMTQGGIPAFSKPPHSVVKYVPPVVEGATGPRGGNYVNSDFLRACGNSPTLMNCIIVQRASLAFVTSRAHSRTALAYVDGACGPTDGGRSCMLVIFVAPAGERDYLGRVVDASCERDSVQHELAHAFLPDGWRGH